MRIIIGAVIKSSVPIGRMVVKWIVPTIIVEITGRIIIPKVGDPLGHKASGGKLSRFIRWSHFSHRIVESVVSHALIPIDFGGGTPCAQTNHTKEKNHPPKEIAEPGLHVLNLSDLAKLAISIEKRRCTLQASPTRSAPCSSYLILACPMLLAQL